jgi:hypothetical protein
MKRLQVCVMIACCLGCGDDAGPSDESHDGGSGPKSGSILSANAATYTESSEATNGTAKTAEATGYTLETANGLAIHGSIEASNATDDWYRFNAGALGTAGSPGFPGLDVRLVIDGDRSERNVPLQLSLDTVAEKGYSSLSAGNYFINAALIKGEDYVIKVSGTPGKDYVLELRGHVE